MSETIKSSLVNNCMVCGSEGKLLYANLNDRLYGNSKGWNLFQCINKKCNLVWLNPQPTKDSIGLAYESYYTHSQQADQKFKLSFLEKAYLNHKYGYFPESSIVEKVLGYLTYLFPVNRNKFDFSVLYLPRVENGKLLDFGCGNGWLMEKLVRLGWNCQGLDFDPKSVAFCQSKGLKVNLGDIPSQNFPDEYFDAITVNHVIEHLYDVDDFLENCKRILKKDGKLVITTPNTNSLLHKKYKQNWYQLDPPRHLNLFNNDNMDVLVRKNGFTVEKSFSSIRVDAWSTIVNRLIRRQGRFTAGKDKKTILDLILGMSFQYYSAIVNIFNKKVADEIVVICKKNNQ